MKYRELCKRFNIEKYSNKYLKGVADTQDIDICIKNMEDEFAYCFIHINGVQMKFRRLQLGMQVVPENEDERDDLWLLISGFGDEKCIRICDIKELYFNYRGWETIHG